MAPRKRRDWVFRRLSRFMQRFFLLLRSSRTLLLIFFVASLSATAANRDLWYEASRDASRQHGIYFYSETVIPKATLLFVHGMQSHAEWLRASGLGDALAEAGIAVFAYDRRGSGQSSSMRGHAESPQDLIGDLHDALVTLRQEISKDPRVQNPSEIATHLMANCFGARIAVPYLVSMIGENRNPIQSLTLIAPSTHMRKNAEYSALQKLSIMMRAKKSYVATPLQDDWFVSSGPGLEWIQNDGLSLREITAGFLKVTKSLTTSMEKNIYKLPIPLLVVTAENDAMVDSDAVARDFKARYQSAPLKVVSLPGEHSLEFSSGPAAFVAEVQKWIFSPPQNIGQSDNSISPSTSMTCSDPLKLE